MSKALKTTPQSPAQNSRRPDESQGKIASNLTKPHNDLEFTLEDLRRVLAEGKILVEYQPKVPLDPTDLQFSVEALSRIRLPQTGPVPPDQFIALAEKGGLILELTDAMICRAFSDWRNWFDHGLTVRLAVNVSPELLDDNRWVERFLFRCREFDIAPEYLILEITESSSKSASEAALEILTRLKLKGMTLSIDDFGTGFSSLATLYRLPFKELKIDKCFTMELGTKPAARALIESTIEMARRLGLKVTAEGVETENVFDQLRDLGCDHAQGYFISKSLPADEVAPFFSRWSQSRGGDERGTGLVTKLAAIQSLLDQAFTGGAPDRTVVVSAGHVKADSGVADFAAIPSLVLQGHRLQALAACHDAATRLKSLPEQAALRAQILELQRLLEFELLSRCDLILNGTEREFRLLPRRSALIGRCSDELSVDVAINCRWLSRGDRGLFLRCGAEDWSIEDLGSRNSIALNGEALVPEKPVALPETSALEIGGWNRQRAPLSLHIRRIGGPNANAVAISASAQGETGPENWPTREDDLRRTWVVFTGSLKMGPHRSCAIRVPAREILADVEFQNGFWIRPRADVRLSLDSVPFRQPVPLVAGATLHIGDREYRVEKGEQAAMAEEDLPGEKAQQRAAGGLRR